MIRVQPTSSSGNRFLIGSDSTDPSAARREVEIWIAENNCCLPRTARHLSVFEQGKLVREWVLVERLPEPVSFPIEPTNAFRRLLGRRTEAIVAAKSDNVIILYPGVA